MVSIIYIENREYPAKIVEDAIHQIKLKEGRRVEFSAIINDKHDDTTVTQAVKDHIPDLVIVDNYLRDDGKYDGIKAARCVKACQGQEGMKSLIYVLLFTVSEGFPAALDDPRTHKRIYDLYVHKFGAIYPPGVRPPHGADDVKSTKDTFALYYGGAKVLLRAIKQVLEWGIIKPGEWLEPDLRFPGE
jgi:hypothetical protein